MKVCETLKQCLRNGRYGRPKGRATKAESIRACFEIPFSTSPAVYGWEKRPAKCPSPVDRACCRLQPRGGLAKAVEKDGQPPFDIPMTCVPGRQRLGYAKRINFQTPSKRRMGDFVSSSTRPKLFSFLKPERKGQNSNWVASFARPCASV